MLVKTLKKIQESIGYNDYHMSKALGISQTNYVYLCEEAQSIRIGLLIKIWKLSKLSAEEFLEALEEEAKGTTPKPRGRKPRVYE